MQFVNLSPFDSLAFQSLDLAGNTCTTIVTKVGYNIVIDPQSGLSELSLIENEPLPLTLCDEYWDDEPGNTRVESDLAPFKPRCDLLVLGKTYAPEGKPAQQWPLRIQLTQSDAIEKKSSATAAQTTQILMDKTLHVFPPGHFRKTFFGWALERSTQVAEVPLRWDYAFGGSSQVANPKHTSDPSKPKWLLNEACFSNPIGCGWIENRHQRFTRKAEQPSVESIAAPCFFYPNEAIVQPAFINHPDDVLTTQQMAQIAKGYPCQPAGLGPIGRSWAPRVALTGTYDKNWEEERWPLAPLDFDEHYWNCAPHDQQCPWPAPDCTIETWFLFSPALAPKGYVEMQLPGHRTFVMARLQDDTPIPLTTYIDTLLLDTEKQQLEVVWRCRIKNSETIKTLETRFEIDPQQPLLKYAESPQTSSTTPKAA